MQTTYTHLQDGAAAAGGRRERQDNEGAGEGSRRSQPRTETHCTLPARIASTLSLSELMGASAIVTA
jgi:hypothetical protein